MSEAGSQDFRGVWTAIVTPFKPDGSLDLEAFKLLLKDQRKSGIAGVIVCGTTGESPTVTTDEKKKLIRLALDECKGSECAVMAGTGSYSTEESIELSRWASDQGVAGLLLVTPYYNRPSQAGLEAHFKAIADAVRCPIMLYNVPGRTGCALTPETIVKLAAHPRIRALKEASGSITLLSEIFDQLQMAGARMQVLTGDDVMLLPALSVGCVGVVSVASNLFPRAVMSIQRNYESGRIAEAISTHRHYYPLYRDLFIDSNPGPIKAALHHAGWCGPTLRPPLAPMNEASLRKLHESLSRAGIASGRKPL